MRELDAVRMKQTIDSQGLCHQPQNESIWDEFFAPTAVERRSARNLCGSYGQENACPVREQCLKWALDNKEIWGVWGGCDESELRRALWVDANGHSKSRCRFPNCPNCKARPGKLTVVRDIDSPIPRVLCTKCDFTWRSRTSAAAVVAFQRMKQRKKSSVRVPRGRVVDEAPGSGRVVQLPTGVPLGSLPETSLVASADRPA